MPSARLPSWIGKNLEHARLQCEAADLLTLLQVLSEKYPPLKKYLLTADGQAPRSTAFFINGELVTVRPTPLTPIMLDVNDVVEIEPAIVGG